MTLYIIVIAVIVIALLLMIFAIYFNKYQFAIIRINEAENKISKSLKEKINLFDRVILIIKDKLKNEHKILDIIMSIKDNDLNNFEINKKLQECSKELNELLDNNNILYEDETMNKIIEELDMNKQDIEAGERFYNDNVVIYNKLIRSFPSNIVGKILRYKKKEFYENEKEEIFEILKEKNKD
jgi:LemA protein